MKLFYSCLFFVIVILVVSCAVQVAPEGGLKDSEPPHLVSSKPPNYSTSFPGKEIELNFDEYVSLNEISSQLIVSPLLKYSPETRIRKKSILIKIRDTLLENTTYTMNFGQGIMDNNEGNKLDNFQFVFSTGSVIDSLDITGKIIKAIDLKTEKGILAMLYNKSDDSLPYLERPVYFSRTNDSGQFRISNISPGDYKLVGLKEADGNYLYTPGEEMIGFNDNPVSANSENVNLKVFNEVTSVRLLRAYSEFPGKVVLVFNTSAVTLQWKWLTDTTKLKIFAQNYSKESDTISIWYKNITSDSLSFYFNHKSSNDTVTLRLFKKTDEVKGRKGPAMEISNGENQTTVQDLYLPYHLQCNRPIEKAEFDKIIFLEDSLPVKLQYVFTDSLKMNINVNHKWKPKGRYSFFIPSGTFTDIYGNKNDTVKIEFITHGENDYGSITIKFQKTDSVPYVVQLIDDKSSVYREFKTTTDTVIELTNLDPRVYNVKFIQDINGNGKWDTGNYLKKIQPENIDFYPEPITVRANWDVEVFIKAPLMKKLVD